MFGEKPPAVPSIVLFSQARPLGRHFDPFVVMFDQLTFPEFDFETEAKVDFPSACI